VALETEKKQVEGESPFVCLSLVGLACLESAPNSVSCFWFSGLRTIVGNSATQAQAVQTAYNSSQQELEELRVAALEACQGVEEGEVQAGSLMTSRLRALSRHATQRVRRALYLGVQKALAWCLSSTRSTSRPSLRATLFLSALTTRWR
jgi:hypothetical protein